MIKTDYLKKHFVKVTKVGLCRSNDIVKNAPSKDLPSRRGSEMKDEGMKKVYGVKINKDYAS